MMEQLDLCVDPLRDAVRNVWNRVRSRGGCARRTQRPQNPKTPILNFKRFNCISVYNLKHGLVFSYTGQKEFDSPLAL